METSLTRRYLITGSQRLSNYFWASLISFGGLGFLITGFISFLGRSQKSDISTLNTIQFFPQGLIMGFYGSLGLLFGMYLWLNIIWKAGSGFNEFNKNNGIVRIFRWGLPGNDRRIDLTYKLKDISAVRVLLKEGVNPRRSIALLIKGKQEIPLTRIGQPIALQDIENEASSLAQFLQVSLETFYKM
uniref:photosystem I assembly protein Ycf4 n=1 Tax=Polulichloris maxima TaxID=2704661 RepID=UPI002410D857|nr:photosystem I assembly protein Ycf4 [Polulichloris maxima]WDY13230.1 photosystem I assembly protein Ycf4 [Polulichloris maxima]